MPLTVEAAREADRAEAQLLLLRMGIAQCLNGGYANGARGLERLRLAVSSARNTRLEHAPPSGVPQLPGWGRFF
jgi:hypothetical protein